MCLNVGQNFKILKDFLISRYNLVIHLLTTLKVNLGANKADLMVIDCNSFLPVIPKSLTKLSTN